MSFDATNAAVSARNNCLSTFRKLLNNSVFAAPFSLRTIGRALPILLSASALSLLVVVNPALADSTGRPYGSFRLLAFNTWYNGGRTLIPNILDKSNTIASIRSLSQFIRDGNYDVITLQELYPYIGLGMGPIDLVNAIPDYMSDLAADLDKHHAREDTFITPRI